MYHRKRTSFDKQGYNPNHLPHQGRYEKVKAKKPKLDQWENPAYDWPPKLPRPTLHKGKTLVNILENEERDRILEGRELEIPDFRSGDVIRATVYNSLSEKNVQEYQGLVFYKRAPNSIRSHCRINFSIEGVNTVFGINMLSPLLHNFEIMKLGSNKLRKKLSYIPDRDINAGRLQEPIIKGVGYKNRSEKARKETKPSHPRGTPKKKLRKLTLQQNFY